MSDMPANQQNHRPRLGWLDAARGVALVAMTVFHFFWDLEYFGYARPGMTSEPAFRWFAHAIAFSFLLIAGASLALAHAGSIRWASLLRRLAQITAAAALISLATWWMTPERFVFFGILHQIALGSVIALAFVRLPAIIPLAAGLACLALPQVARSALFDAPYWWWTGLSAALPPSNDYVPVFPWTGAILIGLAAGKQMAGATPSSQGGKGNAASRALGLLGRHSLAYYLIHQPVLFALLYGASMIAPPDRTEAFQASCQKGCEADNGKAFCAAFCGCVITQLAQQSMFDDVVVGKRKTDDPAVQDIAAQCTAQASGGQE